MGLRNKVRKDLFPKDPKNGCRVATTANVNLAVAPPAAIDGINLADGDRVLVWQQAAAAQNGIYLAGVTAGVWSRAADMTNLFNTTQGAYFTVSEGTLYEESLFQLITSGTINVGITSLTFTKVAQAAGAGVGIYVPLAGTSAPMGGPVTGNIQMTDTFGLIGVGNNLQLKFNTDRLSLYSIIFKLTGEIQTDGVGNGAVAGSARGTGAIDLQTLRGAAGQVASGSYAQVLGGLFNTGSGQEAIVVGGNSNEVSALRSVVVGGAANISASQYGYIGGGFGNSIGAGAADYSVIVGGNSNSSISTFCFIGGGATNSTTAIYSVICGGNLNTTAGQYCFIGGGKTNGATGDYSVIAGGQNNAANGAYSAILGGNQNIASGTQSVVIGGSTNIASATQSAVLGGAGNVAAGDHSWIGAGQSNQTLVNVATYSNANGQFAYADRYGVEVFGIDKTATGVLGGTQKGTQMQSRNTTNATPALLYADGDGATAFFPIRQKSSVYFEININALQTGGAAGTAGDTACWVVKGLIKNVGGTTALVGALSYETAVALGAAVAQRAGDAALALCTIAVAADDASDTLQITVTGEANKNIKWTAAIKFNETRY